MDALQEVQELVKQAEHYYELACAEGSDTDWHLDERHITMQLAAAYATVAQIEATNELIALVKRQNELLESIALSLKSIDIATRFR